MSGTGENNADTASAEPSPGTAGNSTPVRGSGGGNGDGYGPNIISTPQSSLHNGIETALQKTIAKATSQSVAREFARQQNLLQNGYSNSEAQVFYDDSCNNMTTLRVFASMKPGSPLIQVLWGLGKFTDDDAEGDVGGEVLAYTGNRDRFGNTPAMVALPRDNAYKWKGIKGNWEDAEFTHHYADANNRLMFRQIPPAATEEKMLPRLLYLPYELGVFAAQRPRTPYELYEAALRLAGDDTSLINDEHIALVKVWCMGAAYKGTDNSSALVLKTTTVSSSTEAFVEFRQKKCEWLLGPWSPPSGATAQQYSHEEMDQRIERMTSNIMTRAFEALPEVSSRLQQAAQQQQATTTGGGSTSYQVSNPLAGIKQLEGAELYAVLGFCGVTDPMHVPSIWRTYYSSASLLTKRGEIQDQMTTWATEQGYSINKIIRFDKPWFTDVVAADFAMGQARATWELMERGFSAQYGLPVTLAYIAKMNAIERAEEETAHTRTLTESLNLAKTDPRRPPMTLEELKKGVATYAAMVYVHFGKYCDLYKKLVTMRETLESHAVEYAENCYTPAVIMGYWFEVLDKSRIFFFEMLRKSDFDKPQGPTFPVCSLSALFPIIIAGHGTVNGMFPTKWSSASSATSSGSTHAAKGGQPTMQLPPTNVATGGHQFPAPPTTGSTQYGAPLAAAMPDNNKPPAFVDKFGHCHPIVRAEFADYHKAFGGKLQLTLLCKHSDITLDQLLGQHSFKDESGTNTMCYSYVLGVCNLKRCTRVHPPATALGSDFLRDLCKQLKKGRDFLIKNPGLGAKRAAKSG